MIYKKELNLYGPKKFIIFFIRKQNLLLHFHNAWQI